MQNYTINASDWIQKFPLSQVEEDWAGVNGVTQMICSPRDLAGMEQIRAKVARETDLGDKVPVDLFLFSEGEPENRWATKIGGLPYRPRTIKGRFKQKENKWPFGFDEPKVFLAQFCLLIPETWLARPRGTFCWFLQKPRTARRRALRLNGIPWVRQTS